MKDAALKSGKLDEAKRLVQESKITQALAALAEYDTMSGNADDEYAKQLRIACQVLGSKEATVKFLVELPEAEFNSLTSGEALAALNRLNDSCGKLVLERLRQSAGSAQDGRKRVREFRQWAKFREYEDPSTKQLFDGYFTNFMDILDRESVTPTDRQELRNVRELFASAGYAAFLVHFEKALLEVYNADNFYTMRETELRESLDRGKDDMIKDIVDAVARALPARK